MCLKPTKNNYTWICWPLLGSLKLLMGTLGELLGNSSKALVNLLENSYKALGELLENS